MVLSGLPLLLLLRVCDEVTLVFVPKNSQEALALKIIFVFQAIFSRQEFVTENEILYEEYEQVQTGADTGFYSGDGEIITYT